MWLVELDALFEYCIGITLSHYGLYIGEMYQGTAKRGGTKLLIQGTLWYSVPPSVEHNLLLKKNSNAMSSTTVSPSTPQHLSGNVVYRELPYVCIKLLTKHIPLLIREKGVIGGLQHYTAEHRTRRLWLPNIRY